MTETKIPFPARAYAGPAVGLPFILAGTAILCISFATLEFMLVSVAIMVAGLGATAWVGLREVAKSYKAYVAREAEKGSLVTPEDETTTGTA